MSDWYRLLFKAIKSSINAIAMTDLKGNLSYINPAFLRLWGYEHPGEVLGRSSLDFWVDKKQAYAVYEAVFEQGSYEGELVARRVDGSSRHVHFSATMVYAEEDGAPLNIIAYFLDISERKQVEDELNQSISYLNSILESIPDLVLRYDREGNLLDAVAIPDDNKLYMPSHEYLGKNVKDVLPQHVADRFVEAINNTLTTKDLTVINYSLQVPEENLHFETRFSLLNENEVIVLIENISERKRAYEALQEALDELEHKVAERTSELARANEKLQVEISERIRTEKALLKSEERYRSLVNNATEAIIVVQDNLIKFANPKAEQIFARPAEQLLSVPITDFIHPTDINVVMKQKEKRLKGEKDENPFTFRLIAGDGSTKIISKSSDIIDWEERSAVLGLMTDITETKKMEQEILKADKLESIGLMAGGIAHDFNNYLATLLGNINLARLYKNDLAKMVDKLDNMEKVTMRAKDLSNQLFTFAKGGAPVKQKVSIRQLIFEDIKFTLSGSKIRPSFAVAEDLHLVEVDQGQFSQVLNNIALNAVQAMPEGGVIEIGAENVTLSGEGWSTFTPLKEGQYVKIYIKDEGTGIPEKFLPKIFDPFFTTKDKGRGLGLATAYSIVKNHGGYLHVETEMGVGTTFYIFLPAITGPEASMALKDSIFKGTGRIMVMDDDEDLLSVTSEALSALGYEVVLARDGKEAIDKYLYALNNEQPFNLVIMDLTIPGGLGGKQTISELKKNDPEIKAIVISGYSNDPVTANYQDHGFKGMLKKPFTIGELSKLVYQIIG